MACQRFIIKGVVQGVYFRASTRQEAIKLGISGHALNLADGSVEVLACGEQNAIESLQHWLAHGPTQARVDSVTMTTLACRPLAGFVTG